MVFFDQEQLMLFAFEIVVFLVIIFLTAVIAAISKILINKATQSSSQYLAIRIKRYAILLIWAIGIIFAISQVGIFTDILILLLAVTGIGFFVSAYPVLQNIVSHSFFNLQYKIKDVITINGHRGKVIEISDINTILLDDNGDLISVPNVLFLKEIWTKHQISGYEFTIPLVIKKDIDVVDFEKALLGSLQELAKTFKKAPNVVTTKAGDKTTELSLILNLKDPEKKSLVTTEITEKIEVLKAEFTEKISNSQKESKLKQIKDIGK
jgi:small-conductance mechanosensitive channel